MDQYMVHCMVIGGDCVGLPVAFDIWERSGELTRALIAVQEADVALHPDMPEDLRAVLRLLRDRTGYKARLRESETTYNSVVDLLAGMTGESRREAELRYRPLGVQVSLLNRVDWDGDVRPHASAARSDHARALNQAAVEALARFFLGAVDAVDPLVAETQVAWERVQAARRSCRRTPWSQSKQRAELSKANSRYWSMWRAWARSKETT